MLKLGVQELSPAANQTLGSLVPRTLLIVIAFDPASKLSMTIGVRVGVGVGVGVVGFNVQVRVNVLVKATVGVLVGVRVGNEITRVGYSRLQPVTTARRTHGTNMATNINAFRPCILLSPYHALPIGEPGETGPPNLLSTLF